MIELKKDKERYDSIEIPHELSEVVRNAIESKREKKVKIYMLKLAPIAVCAVLCMFIGIKYFDANRIETETNDTANIAVARSAEAVADASSAQIEAIPAFDPESAQKSTAAGAPQRGVRSLYNSYVQDKIDKTVNECVRLENNADAYGEMKEIYSDENVFSYSVTTYPSKITNFYNIKQSDGSDIPLESIVEIKDSDCDFYFTSRNSLVIVNDGEEKEIVLENE